MSECINHLDYSNDVCPDCGLEVDAYGNTENKFSYCSFPDCGCDGARLCMAGEASNAALRGNVEGMWNGNKAEQLQARRNLIISGMEDKERK